MRISVLGAGSWGTALAILLHYNSHQVVLWGHRLEHTEELKQHRENVRLLPGAHLPNEITITSDLEFSLEHAELIVSAVPSQFLRSVIETVKGKDFRETFFVNVAKGIENQSLKTMSQVLREVLPTARKENIATLSGPSFAEEVAKRIPTAVVAASENLETARFVQQVFMTPNFRVYSSDDLRGVELGGSIKNIMAIAAGIADGAKFGDNTKAMIMTRGTVELTRLGVALGAKQKTFAGLSGIGDLIVTCMSKHSRNRHVGEEIGKGRKLDEVLAEMEMVAEGVATTKSLHNLAKGLNVEMPIVNAVYEILFEGKEPVRATYELMTRDAKEET
ncbi:MAG: NAD(P)H-dependent glycerol-3-phosphate dehydrogenase [Ignavibacteriae bacterium]|nr:NAD(P)H-dependent glycerol-3-phosphate dehydrogenase [Ignavibacteriota bacterium]